MFKRLASGIMLTLLLTGLVTLAFIIQPVKALPGPRIYCNPPQYVFDTDNASLGTRFNVTLWIENVTSADPGLEGWEVELHYDDSIINVTSDANGIRAWPSATRNANKYDTRYVFYNATHVASQIATALYEHVSSHEAYCIFGDAIIPETLETPWKGAQGLLGIMEFQIIAEPQKLQELNCTLDITNELSWIRQGGSRDTRATFIDSLYWFEWKAPPNPHMGLEIPANFTDPHFLSFGPLPPVAVGRYFDVKFSIDDLYSEWFLTSATFNMTYNETVVDVIGGVLNVTIASMWTTYTVTYNPGEIYITVNNPSSNPGGTPADVLVATVKFTVKKQMTTPPVSLYDHDESTIVIHDVSFVDHIVSIPSDASEMGLVRVYALILLLLPHDVAVMNLVISKTVVCQSYSLSVKVTVKNQGFWIETINATVKSGETKIGNQTIILESGNMTVLTFEWNTTGFAKGNYTISAYAEPVPGETSIEDNTLADGWIIISMVGDITSETSGPYHGWPDGRCDMSDIYVVCKRFGVFYPNPKYVANFDIDSDGRIDMMDISTVAWNFGKIDP